MDEPTPTFIPILPRTKSDDMTQKMHSVDHRLVRQDGPPDINVFDDEPTDVDGIVDAEIVDPVIPWTPYT